MLSADISRVINFCGGHNLILNISKTQAIIMDTQRYLTHLGVSKDVSSLKINDSVISFSTSVVNLGVTFDSTLSWNEHCNQIAQRVFGTLAQLRRNFSYIPAKIRKQLISSLVFPHFDYASVLFSDMSEGCCQCRLVHGNHSRLEGQGPPVVFLCVFVLGVPAFCTKDLRLEAALMHVWDCHAFKTMEAKQIADVLLESEVRQ